MVRKNREKLTTSPAARWAAVAAAALVLAACASAPRTLTEEEALAREFAPLDPGAQVYLSVDVPRSRPILELASLGGIAGGQAAQALDWTETAVAALYPPEAPRRFLLAGQGKYPSFQAGFSFTFSSAWKKVSSGAGGRYWRSEQDGLSLVIEAQKALVSDGDPFPAAGGVTPPGAFGEIRQGAALAGWVEDAKVPLNRFLAALEIPIQIPADRIIFGLYPLAGPSEGDLYDAAIRLETPSASQARALVSIVSMLRLFIGGGNFSGSGDLPALMAALFSNPPELRDNALILRTSPLEPGRIALLFTMFPVYSP